MTDAARIAELEALLEGERARITESTHRQPSDKQHKARFRPELCTGHTKCFSDLPAKNLEDLEN